MRNKRITPELRTGLRNLVEWANDHPDSTDANLFREFQLQLAPQMRAFVPEPEQLAYRLAGPGQRYEMAFVWCRLAMFCARGNVDMLPGDRLQAEKWFWENAMATAPGFVRSFKSQDFSDAITRLCEIYLSLGTTDPRAIDLLMEVFVVRTSTPGRLLLESQTSKAFELIHESSVIHTSTPSYEIKVRYGRCLRLIFYSYAWPKIQESINLVEGRKKLLELLSLTTQAKSMEL